MKWLPLWVYEVVAAVVKYEDEHAKESACLGAALSQVPAEHLERARAIDYYRRHQTNEKEMQ